MFIGQIQLGAQFVEYAAATLLKATKGPIREKAVKLVTSLVGEAGSDGAIDLAEHIFGILQDSPNGTVDENVIRARSLLRDGIASFYNDPTYSLNGELGDSDSPQHKLLKRLLSILGSVNVDNLTKDECNEAANILRGLAVSPIETEPLSIATSTVDLEKVETQVLNKAGVRDDGLFINAEIQTSEPVESGGIYFTEPTQGKITTPEAGKSAEATVLDPKDAAASSQPTQGEVTTPDQKIIQEQKAEIERLKKEQADRTKAEEEKKLKLDEPSKSKEIDDIASAMGEILQGEIDNFHDMTSWALKIFFWCKGWKCDENAAKTILSKVATKQYRENLYNFLEAVHTDKKEDARFASCVLSSDEKIATVEKTALVWTGRFLNMFHKTPEAVLNFFAGATALLGKFRWLLLRIPGIKAIYHLPFASESIEAAGGWAGRYINQIKEAKKNYGELVKVWKPTESSSS